MYANDIGCRAQESICVGLLSFILDRGMHSLFCTRAAGPFYGGKKMNLDLHTSYKN